MSDTAVAPQTWAPLLPWQHGIASTALGARARWPHALLLAGRRGVGKHVLAMHFARSLLCESPLSGGGACGVCPSCAYVATGSHPDLRVIEPVVFDADGNATAVDVITVDRIRELTEFIQLSTHRLGAKVAVLTPAEAMNPAAANALLKTLEEPPSGTYLLLVSHQPGRLVATVRSRCRVLDVVEPDPAMSAQWLVDHHVQKAPLLLAEAGGAPLLALELADDVVQRDRAMLLADLARPARLSPVAFGARLDASPKDERKPQLANAVYWLLTWVADLAIVRAGGAPKFNPDHAASLSRLAARLAPVALFRYYQELLRQRALLNHPLQPRLVAEALLFEYRSLFPRGLD
jgi:DNA polymerase III subunit delta'